MQFKLTFFLHFSQRMKSYNSPFSVPWFLLKAKGRKYSSKSNEINSSLGKDIVC